MPSGKVVWITGGGSGIGLAGGIALARAGEMTKEQKENLFGAKQYEKR